MANTLVLKVARRFAQILLAVSLIFTAHSPALAAGHRARLSQDLEQRLKGGGADVIRVIVEGDAASLQGIASRYGAKIAKQLQRGLVLEVTAEQLAALAADPAVSHLSGDARVYRMATLAPFVLVGPPDGFAGQ